MIEDTIGNETTYDTEVTSISTAHGGAFDGCFGPPKSRTTGTQTTTSKRPIIAATVRENFQRIIDAQNGVKLLCAKTVLGELDKLGLRPAGIRKANAIGDVLGKHYMGLPAILKDGKMRYALHFADASDEKKAAGQAELDSLRIEQQQTLIVG